MMDDGSGEGTEQTKQREDKLVSLRAQMAALEVGMQKALEHVTDAQIGTVAALLLAQAQERCNMLWAEMLGMGVRVETVPGELPKAVGYSAETGESILSSTFDLPMLPLKPPEEKG